MKIIIRLVLLVALVAVVIWLWGILFPSPEKLIRKQLAEVARTASFVSNEGPLVRMLNAEKLAGCFSPDAQVSFDAPERERRTISGHDEITQTALGVQNAIRYLKVEFLDANVSVSPDKLSATVDLTAKVNVAGEKDLFVQEMRFILKKIDGEWLITHVETLRTLT